MSSRFRPLLSCAIVSVFSLAAHACGAETTDAAKVAFFENRIRPILIEHCFECHNDKKQEGGVRLDFRDAMLAGGDSGASIVPGKPEESLMVEAVRYEGYEMPPDGPLPEEDVDAIVRWIRDGAVWPTAEKPMQPSLGDQNAIREVADNHWAFQSITRPSMPESEDPDWARSPIDKFVHAKLMTHGLKPSPAASRDTLIRRAFNDLIGLPPTPQVIESVFGVSTLTGKNYRDVVDGLLESKHYGERMARHWMDVARYADTRDFLAAADLRYPFAYTYRDWLINAFNNDLSYDEFVKQQLAADFMATDDNDPNLAALGFLTVGPLFRNNTPERVADRIDTVTRGLMGLTASCARCHDHKYDPISIEDYYSLYGIFRDSTRPDEFPTIESPLGQEVPTELLSEYEKSHAAAVAKLDAYESGLAEEARKDLVGRFDHYLASYVELKIAKTETDRGLISKRKTKETAMTPVANNLERFRRNRNNAKHPVLGPFVSLFAGNATAFEKQKAAHLKKYGAEMHPKVRDIVASADDRMSFAKAIGELFNVAWQSNDNPSLVAIRDTLADKQGQPFYVSAKAASQASRLNGKGRKNLQDYSEGIKDVEASHPGAPPKAMALQDAEKFSPVFVMFRGEPSRRGPRVDRRFFDYFAPTGVQNKFTNGSGRLELAERICHPQNPLTSRVLVNRVWRMHFGDGLVADAGDFGLRAEPPVQQELMDWLAASVVAEGWSVKSLHRLIMMSNTYRQQSSADDPPMRPDGTSAAEIDAENRLLWRQNRRRLDFETMRDSMLAAAGRIDLSVGGKSMRLDETPHPTRRTLYAYIDRVDPDPVFATFDVAPFDVSTAQRTETLVPQQALFAMNNPFVTDQARAIVAEDTFQQATTDAERVNLIAERVFQRPARPNEVAMVSKFVAAAGSLMGEQPMTWQYGYGPVDGDNFTPLKHFDGSRYTYEAKFPSPEFGYLMLTGPGGHPGKDSAHSIIRRWTAPRDMKLRIGGLIERKSDRGDGIRGVVRIAGKAVAEFTVLTGSEKNSVGFHQVKQGNFVDFIVDPLKTTTSDGFRWTVVMEERNKANVVETWYSSREFAPPPQPVLSPWEQAAQALLMTNEFLFLD